MLLRQQYFDLPSPPEQLLGHLHGRQHGVLWRQLEAFGLGSVQLRPSPDVERRLVLADVVAVSVPPGHGHHVPELRERDVPQPGPQRELHVGGQHDRRPVRLHGPGPEPGLLWAGVREPVRGGQRAERRLDRPRPEQVRHEVRRQRHPDVRRVQRHLAVQQHAVRQGREPEPGQRAQPAGDPVRVRGLLRRAGRRPGAGPQRPVRQHADHPGHPDRRGLRRLLLRQGLPLDGRREREPVLLQRRGRHQRRRAVARRRRRLQHGMSGRPQGELWRQLKDQHLPVEEWQ